MLRKHIMLYLDVPTYLSICMYISRGKWESRANLKDRGELNLVRGNGARSKFYMVLKLLQLLLATSSIT